MFRTLDQLVKYHGDSAQNDNRSDYHIELEEMQGVREMDRHGMVMCGFLAEFIVIVFYGRVLYNIFKEKEKGIMGNRTELDVIWESLGIANDFMFGKVMPDAELCKLK